MVRLVSAKPPKIDGVEGGSAMPPSTPKPVASTWDQVEERQQRNRGMSKPTITAPVRPPSAEPTTPAPRPRPDGATMPAAPVKMQPLGEIPGLNPIGKAALGGVSVPDGNPTYKPWKVQTGRLGDGKDVTGVQRFVNGSLKIAEQFGSPNPGRGFRSGGRAGVLFNAASMVGISSGVGALQQDSVAERFYDAGYPKDVAKAMATTYIGTYGVLGAGTSAGAEALSDLSFIAATSATGAVIGATFFGIGAIAGAAAGAAAGWSVGRVAAGASAIINLVEGAFGVGGALANKSAGTPENIKTVNLPSIDDWWVHGGLNEDGTSRNGLLGLNLRGAAAESADSAAMSAANVLVQPFIDGGRLYSDNDTVRERGRIEEGYYADHSDVDPKYEFYKQFIQEGYFVSKNANGEYKVDTRAVQEFLWDNARYRTEEDLRSELPKKSVVGDSFYKSVRLTDEMLAGMWDFPDVMP